MLLKFRTEKGRDPLPQGYAEDAEALLQTRTGVLESLGVGVNLLPDDFARCVGGPMGLLPAWAQPPTPTPLHLFARLSFSSCCFSEMASVCAVVGGVLGQEIVKVRRESFSRVPPSPGQGPCMELPPPPRCCL